MKIMEYEQSQIYETSRFIFDGEETGTKSIQAKNLASALAAMAGGIGISSFDKLTDFIDNLSGLPIEFRRSIFRGKNLGNTYTTEQKAKVADGTFKGFFIGDYWEKDNIKYRIADINYWLGTGDTECTTPHLVIVPDSGLGAPQKMNDTNTTSGGYAGSKFGTQYHHESDAIIFSAFGENNVLNHRELLVNAVTNGYSSGGSWCDSLIDLMNEPMVYGSYQMTPGSTGTVTPYRYTIDKTQLALFQLHPEYIISRNASGEREHYWLRDVGSAADFAYVYSGGYSRSGGASAALAVRPAFGII